jgi:hypothetical protein
MRQRKKKKEDGDGGLVLFSFFLHVTGLLLKFNWPQNCMVKFDWWIESDSWIFT